MSQENDIQEEALKWISPIMHHGDELEEKAGPEDQEIYSAEPSIKAFHEGLTNEERAIYFSNRLASQIALHGIDLFFEYSVGIYYYEILNALHVIGANDMAEALKSCKEVVFGDADVPINDFEKMEEMVYNDDRDENAETLEEMASEIEKKGGVCDLFERRLYEYALECAGSGALTRKYD